MSKRLLLFLALLLVISGISIVTYQVLTEAPSPDATPDKSPPEDIGEETKVQLENKFNILLLGSDVKAKGQRRSDTIMVASIDLDSKQIGLVSIPRDTRVKIPGYEGYHKINAAYSYGGLELMTETVEGLLEVSLAYHLQVDYQGFIAIVDTLGGVEVEIEQDLEYVDQAADLTIDLEAGSQTLTGQQALNYVRFRHDALGDIGRIQRQQKFLKAALDKFLTFKTLFKVPKLVQEFNNYVTTNLELAKMARLVADIKNFSLQQLKMELLPGEAKYIGEVSYWLPDLESTRQLTTSLLETKDYFKHQQLTLTVLNGQGSSGLASRVAQLLASQGYKIEQVDNADHFNYQENRILVPPAKVEVIADLADYLQATIVETTEIDQIKVIIGQKLSED
ncbi:LCP family protein [Halanaerobaculum tunisiense]